MFELVGLYCVLECLLSVFELDGLDCVLEYVMVDLGEQDGWCLGTEPGATGLSVDRSHFTGIRNSLSLPGESPLGRTQLLDAGRESVSISQGYLFYGNPCNLGSATWRLRPSEPWT